MLQLQTTGMVIDDSFFPVDQVEALRSYAIEQHEQGRVPLLCDCLHTTCLTHQLVSVQVVCKPPAK